MPEGYRATLAISNRYGDLELGLQAEELFLVGVLISLGVLCLVPCAPPIYSAYGVGQYLRYHAGQWIALNKVITPPQLTSLRSSSTRSSPPRASMKAAIAAATPG